MQIDHEMSKIKTKTQPQFDPMATAAKMENELECLSKMSRMYGKEVEQLKTRLKQRTGYEKVSEIEDKMIAVSVEHDKLEKKRKELKKQMKERGKVLERAETDRENGKLRQEVRGLHI